ncbi:MAG: hypothetical protein AB7O47_07865 [Flavobacteriales bacterium]
MENYRLRPSNNFIQSASWEELHVLTDKWKSDLEFYNFELSFLHKLIDKYYIWLSDEELINEVEQSASKVFTADKLRNTLSFSILKHLRHIEEIMENEFSHDAQAFRNEHEELENKFSSFCKNFQLLKKEVFMLTEQVLDTESVGDYM